MIMDKKRISEAIEILDKISNSVKESSELGQALEAALYSLEKQLPKMPSIEGDGYAPDGTFVYDTSTKVIPKAIYMGFSSHDCEAHYKCPLCKGNFGSWSTTFYKKNGKEHCKCPRCQAELVTGL